MALSSIQKKRGRWLGHFRRATSFLRPQRRRIALAIACSLALAVSLAGSLSAIQPILHIFVTSRDGPRAALFQMAAERSFGLDLQPYDPERHGEFSIDAPTNALVIKNIHAGSRLKTGSPAGLAGVREGDLIFPSAQHLLSRAEFLEFLAAAHEPQAIKIASPLDATARDINIGPKETGLWEAMLVGGLQVVGRIMPADTSPQSTSRALMIVFAAVFALVLFSNACRFVSQYMVIIASNRAVMDMRRAMYRTIMHLPMSWFGPRMSETMSRVVTDCKDVERGYRALFGKLTTEPIKIVALLIAAIITDWRITLFALVVGPLGILIVTFLGKKIRKANRKLLAGYAQMMGVLNAALGGMKVVRAYNRQTTERRRMWQAERRLLKQLLKIGRFESMTGPLLEITGIGVAIVGIVFLAERVFSGVLPAERFLGLVVFLIFIFDAVRKISAVYPRLAKADGAAERVFELIDRPTEAEEKIRLPRLPAPRRAIEFQNVSYTYPGSREPALVSIDLTIAKGQKTALVGPNGSGKTTFVSLLVRFLQPDTGQILFDETDILDCSISSLRDNISLATQDAVVFALSAFDNISYGLPGATAEQVFQAAKKAYAHEFIERLPDGYRTVLGEFGTTLSGGERQRLALARAFLRDAPIFISDEATSQVDAESEKKIQQATSDFMGDRTAIVIAHRLHTIVNADRIAVFDRGRIISVGRHDELLKQCELYRTLYKSFSQES